LKSLSLQKGSDFNEIYIQFSALENFATKVFIAVNQIPKIEIEKQLKPS